MHGQVLSKEPLPSLREVCAIVGKEESIQILPLTQEDRKQISSPKNNWNNYIGL